MRRATIVAEITDITAGNMMLSSWPASILQITPFIANPKKAAWIIVGMSFFIVLFILEEFLIFVYFFCFYLPLI
jgi:hypothetical protein